MVERDRARRLVDRGDGAMALGLDCGVRVRRHRHVAHVAAHGRGRRRLVGFGCNRGLALLAARGGQDGKAEGEGQSCMSHNRLLHDEAG